MSFSLVPAICFVGLQTQLALALRAMNATDHANLGAAEQQAGGSEICHNLHINQDCKIAPGKLLLFGTVNHEMIDFYQQWYASASKFLDRSCMHLMVLAEDPQAESELIQLSNQFNWGLDVRIDLDVNENMTSLLAAKRLPFGSDKYNNLVSRRPFYVKDFLQQGCTTMYVDTDTIWKMNPFMEIIAMNKGKEDFYITDDSESKRQRFWESASVCTCFMYINPTQVSKDLVNKWCQAVRAGDGSSNDQVFFNEVLNRDILLYHSLTILPYEKFPPGSSYQTYKQQACVAHANWMIGHAKKAEFLKAVAEDIHLKLDN